MVLAATPHTGSHTPHVSKTIIGSWTEIVPSSLERQDDGTLADATALTKREAYSDTSNDRLSVMVMLVNRLTNGNRKWVIRAVGTVIGMVTCISGAQVLTARLGPLALPGSLALAAGLTWIADGTTVRAYTNRRKQELTFAALTARTQAYREKSPINVLAEANHQASMSLIQSVEADNLSNKFPINTVISVGLNGAEYVATLWIVSLMGLPGGLILEAIVSLIPIGIQAATAVAESESCALPEACAELIQQYDSYLWDWENLSAEEAEKEQYHIRQIDLKLKFLPYGDPNGRLKNLGMALADLDIEYQTHRKHRLGQEGIRKVKDRQERLRQEIAALPKRCPHKGVGMVDAQLKQLCDRWVKEEKQRLETESMEDIELIRAEHGMKIQQCDDEITRAWERYRSAEQHWRDSQDDHGLPQSN